MSTLSPANQLVGGGDNDATLVASEYAGDEWRRRPQVSLETADEA